MRWRIGGDRAAPDGVTAGRAGAI